MDLHKSWHLTDAVYHSLRQLTDDDIVILESQLEGHAESKQTLIAAKPGKKLVVEDSQSKWVEAGKERLFDDNPWRVFREFRRDSGWLFGYIGYDMKNEMNTLHSSNRPRYKAPDLCMMEPTVLFKIADGRIEQILGEPIPINLHFNNSYDASISTISRLISENDYASNVKKIKEHIKDGDFYELNYSYPVTASFSGDHYGLYKKMRAVNPVPFGSYLELENFSICCSSPERFLKNSNGHLVSEPIKGTAGRSADPDEDKKLRDELKNAKNEAENLMIVDLVRHDMSQVAMPGSVRVSKLYDIQAFDTVYQLISRIEGQMKKGTDPVDAIRACFPMGSMTGAPKRSVMEHIEKLETYKRGIYSGSIGYFTPNGDFDLNVVIRTAIIQGDTITYPVGGAITGDSDPSAEWEETQIKAKTLTSLAGL